MALADKLVVNDFLKRTLPIFRPNDIQKFSNGLTSLESAFNVISTGLVNVNNIQKAHARSQKLNAREIVAETKQITTAGVLQEPTTLSSIGPLQTLLESIKKLNDALERLDLTPKNVAAGSTPMGGGDASPDIDIDIDVGKKRKRGFSLPRIGRIGRSFTSTIGRTLSLGVSQALRTSGGGALTAVSSDVTKTLLGIATGTAGLSAIFGGSFGGGGGSFGGAGASGTFDGAVSGSTKGSFQNIMDIAAKVGAPHPEVVAAQWALESAYGTKMSGKNNPFGQKAKANEPGTARRTREVLGGRNQMITDRFKDYDSLEDAIRDHVNKWNKKYTQAGTTPLEAVSNIKAKGYATDPNYVNAVAGVIASNGIDPNQPFTYTKEIADASGDGVGRKGSGFSPARAHPITGVVRPHKGLDIKAPTGTHVYSVQSGVVKTVKFDEGGYGHYIVVEHGQSDRTLYAHLSKTNVAAGQAVSKSQLIGEVGSTGGSTGAHLHFEFFKAGKLVDPERLFDSNKWIVGGQATIQDAATVAAPNPAIKKPVRPPPPRQPKVGSDSFKAAKKQATKVFTMFADILTR